MLSVREVPGVQRMGSACSLELVCADCGPVTKEGVWTSPKSGVRFTGYDINRRLVAAAVSSGIGYAQVCRFFAMLSLPTPMHRDTWWSHKNNINICASRASDKHLQEAAEIVRKTYLETALGNVAANGSIQISVSLDGTWMKRGHRSHMGLVSVIELFTGLILDYHVLCNFCQPCLSAPDDDDPAYPEWHRKHAPVCPINHPGSSNSMEVAGAKVLFARSEDLHKFQYVKMLGDGDAKTHAAVVAMDPYDGVGIEKVECVNHVSKRMGTALRNLVSEHKGTDSTLGGRGKLTNDRIDELTGYYGRAIKDNVGNLEGMQRAVWASFFHTISTDEDPHHSHCPDGPNSWCKYKRAEYHDVPPPPRKNPLPRGVGLFLPPVYKRLGSVELLKKCLLGKTQNANECFHSTLWHILPKVSWAGRKSVETAAAIAVPQFNKGSNHMFDVLMEMELSVSQSTQVFVEKTDVERVKKSTRCVSTKETKRREKIATIQRRERRERAQREGVQYAAGAF